MQRRLFTPTELKNFETSSGVWTHITQVWLVRQITEQADGSIGVEDRDFVTNIAAGRLKPHEKLTLIRAHWRIENDARNSLDMQWDGDSTPWCTIGAALCILDLLLCMAYNLIQHVRRRHCVKRPAPPRKLLFPPGLRYSTPSA